MGSSGDAVGSKNWPLEWDAENTAGGGGSEGPELGGVSVACVSREAAAAFGVPAAAVTECSHSMDSNSRLNCWGGGRPKA
jgi:hypothetical protein